MALAFNDLDRATRDLSRRTSPILSDGTRLCDLIDLDSREVSMRVLNDPEIHRMELDRVFGRSWNVVGHVSEIPNVGDYVVRHVAQDQVLVTRSDDGEIHVLLNACSHRGMRLCWATRGNASSFKCPYHGWTFTPAGNLLGAPYEKAMYGGWDKRKFGLMRARVGFRHGIIFATFSAQTPPLEEYLGDIGWYLDQMFGTRELEALGSPTSSVIEANWKVASDNNSGDGYHTPSLHRSMMEVGFHPGNSNDAKSWAVDGCYDVSTPQGHGLRCVESAQSVFKTKVEGASHPFDGWFLAGNLFPGNGVHSTSFPTADNARLLQTADISVTIPRSHGSFEIWRLPMIEKSAAAAAKREMARKFVTQVTMAQTDDFVAFQQIQLTAQGAAAAHLTMKYNALLGVNKPADWPGPGLVYAGFSKDDNQWNFWLRWYDLMTAVAA